MKPKVTKNIVQLMPAQGWFCKYKQDDGMIEYSRVACFALLRITEPTAAYEMVVAMDVDSDGLIDIASDNLNFVGLEHETDPDFRKL